MKFEKLSNKKILVIDDDTEMLDLYKTQLSSRGYDVHAAASGGEGLELIQKDEYRLVILDLRMQIMDGIVTLEQIKSIDPEVEVIMVSGEGNIGSAVEAMKKGAVDFIQKPVQMEELLFLIEKAFDRRQIRYLIAVYEASREIFSAVKVEGLLESVIDHLLPLFRSDECALMLKDSKQALSIAVSRGLSQETRLGLLEMGEKAVSSSSKTHGFLLNPAYEKKNEHGLECKVTVFSGILAPLCHHEEVFGLLYLGRVRLQERFTGEDLRYALMFASQIAHTVRNTALYDDLNEKVANLRKAQEELTSAKSILQGKEHLADLGLMISSMAHEINNPLTAVIGYSDLLLRTSGVQMEMKEQLGIVFREAKRCHELVQDLLAYSKPRKLRWQTVDPISVVRETLDILFFELKRSAVDVRVNAPADLPTIEADPSKLKQLLLNLMKNACQAFESRASTDRRIEIGIRPESLMILTVSDNGTGIPAENLPNIFKPFFTTKPSGVGTGLGLGICKTIVEEHGGDISVSSKIGQGTIFTIRLPYRRLMPSETGTA